MKRILFLLIILFLHLSCEKIYKYDKQNILPLKTSDDYNRALAGIYNRLINGIVGNFNISMISIADEDDLNIIPNNSIFIIGTRLNEDSCNFCPYSLSSDLTSRISSCGGGISSYPSDDYLSVYRLLYMAIAGANDILSKTGDINKLNSEIKKMVGEVYFVRAYSYFRLARLYGQVPIVASPDVDFTLEKPPFAKLYYFIANDLLKAIDLLPKSNNEARIKYETPNKGTAKTILAEVYLTMGGYPVYDQSKYTDAGRVAGEVIDSASYFGFGLMPDLADLWNGQHIHNNETVFSIYLDDYAKKNNSWGFNNFNNYTTRYGDFNFSSSFSSYNKCIAAPNLYNSFPRNYRKEMSFQTRKVPDNLSLYDLPSYRRNVHYDSLYLKHYDSISYCTNIAFKKFYTQFSIPDSILLKGAFQNNNIYGYYNGGVVYIMRYAQTLLTYAEAKARSGNLDATAYEAINKVRRRANKVDLNSPSKYDLKTGLSSSQFADTVVQERAWELCGEPEGRWFDMVRLELAKNLIEIKQKQHLIVYPIPINRNTYFLPIPAGDNALDPNLD